MGVDRNDAPVSVSDMLEIPGTITPMGKGGQYEAAPAGPHGYPVTVSEVDGERVRIYPYHGDDCGWFSLAEVKAWRDAAWARWDSIGLTATVMARLMFPENWK